MDKKTIEEKLLEIYETTPGNIVTPEMTDVKEVRGMRIFEPPIINFGSAEDPLFEEYKKPGIIGPWFKGPKEWLPGAKTVISFFFPFSEDVRSSMRVDGIKLPSLQWLMGRIEGQEFILACSKALEEWLVSEGQPSIAPSASGKVLMILHGKGAEEFGADKDTYGSNWSERHAAYVSGLGTFALSKGMITRKGIAGRFMSVITALELEPDKRDYTGIYDYCTNCGKCAERCPGKAITIEKGKDHNACSGYVASIRDLCKPRFGCGMCQTDVPCEHGIPGK